MHSAHMHSSREHLELVFLALRKLLQDVRALLHPCKHIWLDVFGCCVDHRLETGKLRLMLVRGFCRPLIDEGNLLVVASLLFLVDVAK